MIIKLQLTPNDVLLRKWTLSGCKNEPLAVNHLPKEPKKRVRVWVGTSHTAPSPPPDIGPSEPTDHLEGHL